MENRKNVGFLPIKNVSSVCTNLFSSGAEEKRSLLSPMTELSVNLELSSMSTPRRRLSLTESNASPSESSPSVADSLESGICVDSPLADFPDFDSPTIQHIRSKKLSSSGKGFSMRRQIMTRRSFSSPVMVRKPLEPLNFNEASSPFRTINTDEKHSDVSLCEMSDQFPDQLEDSSFKLKRLKTGRSLSAPPEKGTSQDVDVKNQFDDNDDSDFDTCSKGSEEGDDDGFFDELSRDLNDNSPKQLSSSVPSNLMGLIRGPIVKRRTSSLCLEEDKENCIPSPTEEEKGTSQDADVKNQVNELGKPVFQKPVGIPYRKSRSRSFSIKRDNPSDMSPSPVSKKKRPRIVRSQSVLDVNTGNQSKCAQPFKKTSPSNNQPKSLHRSQSFDTRITKSPSVDITALLDYDDKNLLGDRSKKYCLPTTKSKHPDLKAISPETLSDLLDGKYSDVVEKVHIVDCRYPYEFEGGHIKGAVNIYEKEVMQEEFINEIKTCENIEKRQIIIFHCEFSSKRGPAMCKFLRNKDRTEHQHCYPQLYYPEMYILEGGYREFFAQKKECCVPQTYREMFDPAYSQQLKQFSRRSKSWSDGDGKTYRSRRTGLRF